MKPTINPCNISKEIQLRPCPFCGDKPEIGIGFDSYNSGENYIRLRAIVRCKQCDIEKRINFIGAKFAGELIPFEDYIAAVHNVTEQWNIRNQN